MNIVFAGTPYFSVPCLELLIKSNHSLIAVYTQPDRAAGRGRRTTASSAKAVAQNHHIPVVQPASLKTSKAEATLFDKRPDLMVVVAYGLILPQAILNIPRLGCINVHASLLPRWRGAAPIQRAIEAGDSETGITVVQMERGLDTGAMLKKMKCPILPDDTAAELHDRLAQLGATALSAVLPEIESGTVRFERQDGNQATYAEKITKTEAEIDWSMPAVEIDRKIKAFNPWPVAHTTYRGKRLRIWRSEVGSNSALTPSGTVNSDNKNIMEVATGDGVLRLLEIQTPGGKRISARAFLNAHQVNGVLLG